MKISSDFPWILFDFPLRIVELVLGPLPFFFPKKNHVHFLFHMNWWSNYSSHHFFLPFPFLSTDISLSFFAKFTVFFGFRIFFWRYFFRRLGTYTKKEWVSKPQWHQLVRWWSKDDKITLSFFIWNETTNTSHQINDIHEYFATKKSSPKKMDRWIDGRKLQKKTSDEWPAIVFYGPTLSNLRLVSLWPCEAFPGWIKIPELNRHWKGGGVIIEMSDVEWIIFPIFACCFTSRSPVFCLFFRVDLSIPKNSTSCQIFGMHTFVILFKEAKITGYSSLSAGYCALLTLPWHTKVTRQVEQVKLMAVIHHFGMGNNSFNNL